MLRDNEIVVDLFAGGGGASCGIEMALGRPVDVAVNHDEAAIALHEANHPTTAHYHSDVFEVDPVEAAADRPVGLLWASPDCTHFSKAKGSKPLRPDNLKSRALAWVVKTWAEAVRPRVIMVENVEEFQTWGPVVHVGDDKDGNPVYKPDPDRKCETFERWVEDLIDLGYCVEWREMRACDYGAPTIRKRLFVIARCDGEDIVWPTPTHAPADEAAALGLEPFMTAADCIDWSEPCASVFLTKEGAKEWAKANGKRYAPKRPLAENTLKRVARGVGQYVVENPDPFVVPLTHHGKRRRNELSEPLPTVTAANRGEQALVEPGLEPITSASITKFRTGSTGHDMRDPLHTITTSQSKSPGARPGGAAPLGVVQTRMAPVVSYAQHGGSVRSAEDPLHTVAASPKDQNQVIEAELSGFVQRDFGQSTGHDLGDPMATVTAGGGGHCRLVEAELSRAATMVQSGYGEREGQAPRTLDLGDPLGTVVAGGVKHAVVEVELLPTETGAAFIAQNNAGHYKGAGRAADDPLGTVMKSGSHHSLVTAALAKLRGNPETHGKQPSIEGPLHTIGTGGNHGVVVANLTHNYTSNTAGGEGQMELPLKTVTTGNHAAVVESTLARLDPDVVERGRRVYAFLTKYYGTAVGQDLFDPAHTVTTNDRFGLVVVTVEGEDFVVTDIALRMLQPRELYRAQGFPDSYVIDRRPCGKKLTKTEQVRMVGNSVCPPNAAALVRANLTEPAYALAA